MNWVNIGSGNGLSPVRRQAITWTNADLLPIRPLGINFSEIQIKIQNFSFMKIYLKISSAKWQPFCAGWDELNKSVGTLMCNITLMSQRPPTDLGLGEGHTELTRSLSGIRMLCAKCTPSGNMWCVFGQDFSYRSSSTNTSGTFYG